MYDDTPTPCLEKNWPKIFKKEKQFFVGSPPPPPPTRQLFQDLRDFRGLLRTDLVQNPHPLFHKASYGPAWAPFHKVLWLIVRLISIVAQWQIVWNVAQIIVMTPSLKIQEWKDRKFIFVIILIILQCCGLWEYVQYDQAIAIVLFGCVSGI